jgi:hypothetical protein
MMHGREGAGHRESETSVRVWTAATSKVEPRRKQDWFFECLQGERAHALAACGVATLCCPSPALLETETLTVG